MGRSGGINRMGAATDGARSALLVVNNDIDDVGDGNGEGGAQLPPQAPSHHHLQVTRVEMKKTWQHLKIPMVVLFAACLGALALLGYGSSIVAVADSHQRAMFDSLINAIGSFETAGYLYLFQSTFSVSSCNSSCTWFQLDRVSDPHQSTVDKSSANTYYNSSLFQKNISVYVGEYIDTDISFNSNDNNNSNNALTFVFSYSFMANKTLNSTVVGDFAVSVPYYYTQVTTSSLRQLPSVAQQQCERHGGSFDPDSYNCTSLFLLAMVCIQLDLLSSPIPSSLGMVDASYIGWELRAGGKYGCGYPFQNAGIYSLHNFTNATIPVGEIALEVILRSSDDPYISLQALSEGKMSLTAAFHWSHQRGIYFIVMACLIGVVSFMLGIILFFVKGSKKRAFRIARQIPSYYSRPPIFRYLAVAVAGFAVTIGIAFPLLAHWSVESTWTYTPFIGLILIVWFGPVGLVALLIFWQMANKNNTWSRYTRTITLFVVASILVLLSGLSVIHLIKPWRFDYGPMSYQPDYLQVFFGILITLLLVPFAALTLHLCIRYTRNSAAKDFRLSSATFTSRASGQNNILAVLGVFVLLVVFVATAYLPPIWNVPVVNNYNTFVSPYSILHLAKSNISTLKLYLDVVVFYAFVGLVCVFAILARYSRAVHSGAARWIRVHSPYYYFSRFLSHDGNGNGNGNGKKGSRLRSTQVILDTSVGEILLVTLVCALAAWWWWWWFFGYGRLASISDKLERLARVLGHMCNLFASLLLFPVTRNSMWVELLGVPFERAIKYHRWAGAITFFFLSGHMLAWWSNWGTHGTLIHNILSVQNIPHSDNWSIPMMHLTWLGAAVMILLSQNWFRRKRFELFYYTHHFFIVFFITGLIHSWSMWYFTGGGMILWFIDRLIRFSRSAKIFVVHSISDHGEGDTTQISLQSREFKFRAGQYAFINIPTITPLEWHPFTISSAPGDFFLIFHIKNMGKNSWTSRLSKLNYSSDLIPTVNVDGPYGNPPSFTNHENVILIAGGIGITPIISILKDQYQYYKLNPTSSRLKNIFFIWVVRDYSSIQMFEDVFRNIYNDSLQDKFHVYLYVTQRSFAKSADNPHLSFKPNIGRPNMHQQFSDISKMCTSAITMVCGPASMVNEVQNAALFFHFDLHTETFEL